MATFNNNEIIGKPIASSDLNTDLLDRPSRATRHSLSADMSNRIFNKSDNSEKGYTTVRTPNYGKRISYSQLEGLSIYKTPYPAPSITVTPLPTVERDVYSNTNDITFNTTINVNWLTSEWPSSRERGADDILQFEVTVYTEQSIDDGEWTITNSEKLVDYSKTGSPSKNIESINYSSSLSTDGLDGSDINASLKKSIRFRAEAALTVDEFIASENFNPAPEVYTSSVTTNDAYIIISIYQLPEDSVPVANMKTIQQKNDTAQIYVRSIDSTVVTNASRGQRYQFNNTASLKGWTIDIPEAPGRSPVITEEYEWQYYAGTSMSAGIANDLHGANGSINGTNQFLDVSPLSAVWQGYQFRLGAKATLTLSNPSETREGEWAYTGLSNPLFIDYQLKNPEYILPDNNTVEIPRGFTDSINFYTYWTGESAKTYYWRIETVSSSTLSVASAWNTSSGSFTNEENTFQTSEDAEFNVNAIPMDSKEGATSSNFKLSIYTNSDFTGRVASTVFSLSYIEPILKLIAAQVDGTDLYTEDDIKTLDIVETDSVVYVGGALYYGLGKTVKWSYTVVTDPNDAGDVVNEINGYVPNTKYNLTTIDFDGSTARTQFILPNLQTPDDSDSGGTAGNKEVLDINIWDSADNLKDKVRLRINDKLEEIFAVTRTLRDGSLETAVINGEYILTPGTGTIGFGSAPYVLKSPSGNLTINKTGWQYKGSNGNWYEYNDSRTYYNDVYGNSKQAVRDVQSNRITWTNWNSTRNEIVNLRYYATAYNSVTKTYQTVYSNTARMYFYVNPITYNKGIIMANILPTETSSFGSQYIVEGQAPVRMFIQTWDVPAGTEIEYEITDNAGVLPDSPFNTDSPIRKKGQVVAQSGPILNYMTIDVPYQAGLTFGGSSAGGEYPVLAYWGVSVNEYAQFKILNPRSIGLSENSPGVQYGNISNTDDPRFPSPRNANQLDITVQSWDNGDFYVRVPEFTDSLNRTNIEFDEDYTGTITIEVVAKNVVPSGYITGGSESNGMRTAGYWKAILVGDAAKYFQNSTDLSLPRSPNVRGEEFSAFDFDNDAATVQKKYDGRYRMTAVLTPDGVKPDIAGDVEGKIVVVRVVPNLTGAFYTGGVVELPIKIKNTVPQPFDFDSGITQLAVNRVQTSVREGETAQFYIFDKARSSLPEHDSWNTATPIPAGTPIYWKAHGSAGFDGDDFEPISSPLTMRADGQAGPAEVTITADNVQDSSLIERFRVRAAFSGTNLNTAGSYAESGWVEVVDDILTFEDNAPGLISGIGQRSSLTSGGSVIAQIAFVPDGRMLITQDTAVGEQIEYIRDWGTRDLPSGNYSISFNVVSGTFGGTFTGQSGSLASLKTFKLEFGGFGTVTRDVDITISRGNYSQTARIKFVCVRGNSLRQ